MSTILDALRIRTKVVIMAVVIQFISVFLFYQAYTFIKSSNNIIDHLKDYDMEIQAISFDLKKLTQQSQMHGKNIYSVIGSVKDKQKFLFVVYDLQNKLEEQYDLLEKILTDKHKQEIITYLKSAQNTYNAYQKKLTQLAGWCAENPGVSYTDVQKKLFAVNEEISEYEGHIDKILLFSEKLTQKRKLDIMKERKTAKKELALTLIVCFAASVGVTVYMFVLLTHKFRIVTEMVKNIAGGDADLTKRINIHSADEFGILAGWFNRFISHLNRLVCDIRRTFSTVMSSNERLQKQFVSMEDKIVTMNREIRSIEGQLELRKAKSSEADTAASTQKQEATGLFEHIEAVRRQSDAIKELTETQSFAISNMSGSIEEQAATVNSISQNTESTNELIGDLSKLTEENRKMIHTTSQEIKNMVVSIDSIKDFANLITEISGKTNLLAMNAAIEAAHAGDAGKGFAVVAEEIRRLSDRSGEETDKVKLILQKIISSTELVNHSFTQNSDVFGQVTERVDKARRMVEDISTSLKEQTLANSRMLETVNEIKGITEKMNESKNNLTSSCESMSEFGSTFFSIIEKNLMTFNELNGISEKIAYSLKHVLDGTVTISKGVDENKKTIDLLYNETEDLSSILDQFTVEEENSGKALVIPDIAS